jgi:prophage regulatory protein
MEDRLLTRPQVEFLVGLGRSTLYQWMAEGRFPKPVRVGNRLVRWRLSDIDAWVQARETKAG